MSKKLFVLLLVLSILFCGCTQTTEPIVNENWVSPLSDDLDVRFQQIFFDKLDNPTVEKVELFDWDNGTLFNNSHGSGGGAVPERSNNTYHRYDAGVSKGAFYLIEPPKSSLVYGLEHLAVRGIYDFTYEPFMEDKSQKSDRRDSTFLSFSMEVEVNDCELRDLVLSYDGSDFLNQTDCKINLDLDEKGKVFVDLSQVGKITGNVNDNRFVLNGVLVHDGEEYDFRLQF